VSEVVIVDSGGANLGSVRNALARLGVAATLTLDAQRIRRAARVLLPGVGAAAPVMRRLREAGLVEVLRTLQAPLLGICVGMQVLFERSEEGDVAGLGLLPGAVRRMVAAPGLRLPHMGWNRLRRERDSPLLDGLGDGTRMYFVHGYAAAAERADCVASVDYGARHCALVVRGNVAGVQFHPERSGAAGARLLSNFLAWQPT
jgi:glutamine amidotransferase